MKIKSLILLAAVMVIVALMAYGAVRPEYPVGCALRVTPKFSPTGSTAKYRYTGYFEAIEVIYHSSMTAEAKDAAIQTLVESREMDKYLATVN